MPLPKIVTPTYELRLPSTDQVIKCRPFLVKEEKVRLKHDKELGETRVVNNRPKIVEDDHDDCGAGRHLVGRRS